MYPDCIRFQFARVSTRPDRRVTLAQLRMGHRRHPGPGNSAMGNAVV